MEDFYKKEINLIKKNKIEKENELVKNIIKTSDDLESANNNLNYAEEELIDYYIYQIKAYQSKLDYLIKNAKKQGISLEIFNNSEKNENKL